MYIYIRYIAIMKIMCPPVYHHNGSVATPALGHMMIHDYGYGFLLSLKILWFIGASNWYFTIYINKYIYVLYYVLYIYIYDIYKYAYIYISTEVRSA